MRIRLMMTSGITLLLMMLNLQAQTTVAKQKEILTLKNFELLRGYVLTRGKKSSYSGLYLSYQVVFEDDNANIRFALKNEIKPDEQKNTENSAIEVSEINRGATETCLPYLVLLYEGNQVAIASKLDPDPMRSGLYYQQALEDFAKRINYIKTKN